MTNIPDPNNSEVIESEVKVFRQKYYIVDNEFDDNHELREARVEVMADEDGVFLECKEDNVAETLSIPTADLAVKTAKYILSTYDHRPQPGIEEAFAIEQIKFIGQEVQKRVAHELWRLENHFRSPHGPVEAQGAPELLGHLKTICDLLDLKPAPYN